MNLSRNGVVCRFVCTRRRSNEVQLYGEEKKSGWWGYIEGKTAAAVASIAESAASAAAAATTTKTTTEQIHIFQNCMYMSKMVSNEQERRKRGTKS